MTNRNPKNNSQVNQFLTDYFNIGIAIVLVLFLFLAYLFVLYPQFLELQSNLHNSVRDTQNVYNNNRKKLANLQALNDSYKSINTADLQKFNSVLPDKYTPERLFGELEEIINRGGWTIGGIDLSVPDGPAAPALFSALASSTPVLPNNQKLGAVNINVSVSAIDYAGLKSLLKILENNIRLFDVTSVSFSPSGNSASLVLTTYYYKPVQQ
jgi:hypothetical protein